MTPPAARRPGRPSLHHTVAADVQQAIRSMYVVDRLGCTAIADRLGLSANRVYALLLFLGVTLRGRSEAARIRCGRTGAAPAAPAATVTPAETPAETPATGPAVAATTPATTPATTGRSKTVPGNAGTPVVLYADDVIRRYRSGEPAAAIAASYGCKSLHVFNLLYRHRVARAA